MPALVGQFAPKVADAAGFLEGERVLDVACGTEVLARETLKRVGANVVLRSYTTSDGNVRFDVSAHIVTGKKSQ